MSSQSSREARNAYAREYHQKHKRNQLNPYQRVYRNTLVVHQKTICLFCKNVYVNDYDSRKEISPSKWKHRFCSKPCQREYLSIQRIIKKLLLEPHEVETELKRLGELGSQYVFPLSHSEYTFACSLPKTNEFWRFGKRR